MRMRACACDGRVSVHAMNLVLFFLSRLSTGCIPGGRGLGPRAELLVLLARKNVTPSPGIDPGEGGAETSRKRATRFAWESTRDIVQFFEGEREREEVLIKWKKSSCDSRCGIVWTFREDETLVGKRQMANLSPLYFSRQEVCQPIFFFFSFLKSDHLFLYRTARLRRGISLLPSRF